MQQGSFISFFFRENVYSTLLCNKAKAHSSLSKGSRRHGIALQQCCLRLSVRMVNGGGGNGTAANIDWRPRDPIRGLTDRRRQPKLSSPLAQAQHDWRHRLRFPFPAPPWLRRALTHRTHHHPHRAVPFRCHSSTITATPSEGRVLAAREMSVTRRSRTR
jgi:hypothetical protein